MMLDFFPRGDILPGPGLPAEMERLFNGSFLVDGKGVRVATELADLMGSEWVAAYHRRPEVFAELFRAEQNKKSDMYDASKKGARRHYRFFQRHAEAVGMDVAEFVFGVDPRHSGAFAMEKEADFALMMAMRSVPVEMVVELRELHGRPMKPVWASALGVGKYKPWNARHARRLGQMVTGSRHAYSLMRAGVPAASVKALHEMKNREEAYDAVTEAAFLGVLASYGVAAVLSGVLDPDILLGGFENGIAVEYLTA